MLYYYLVITISSKPDKTFAMQFFYYGAYFERGEGEGEGEPELQTSPPWTVY